MQQLIQDIKNNTFLPMYLLCGEEDYLRRQYRDKLKNALVTEGDTMNYHYFEGKNINVGEIIDLAETLPFFADRRVIFIENSGLLKAGGEQMAQYLETISPSTTIVFIDTQYDKRSKLYKTIANKGRVSEFGIQDENTLKRWILGMVKKEEKIIASDALDIFLERTGNDMENIKMELEKLICYGMDQYELTKEDVMAVTTVRVSGRIFEMVAAIAEKKQTKALDMYHDLLTLKETPLGILALIARQFNLMLQIKELSQKGLSDKTIGEKVSLSPYIVKKYVAQAKHFKMAELKRALEACVEADEAVKTGKLNDVLSVELLIVEYSK